MVLLGFSFTNWGIMNKNLRYKLAFQMFRSNKLLKAIAMSLLVRKRTNTNIVKNFTLNKLATITGMHPTTIKKRLQTLNEYGLLTYSGKNLVFRSLVSKHKVRNIRLAKIAYKKIKDIERSLQAILVANIQLRKDYAKRTILTAHRGRNTKQVKRAQKLSRRYKWAHDYVERGLGYKKIAKTLNCCKETAIKIVKFAEKWSILKKQTHIIYERITGINFYPLNNLGYTYTTKNFAVTVKANTYKVAPCFRGW